MVFFVILPLLVEQVVFCSPLLEEVQSSLVPQRIVLVELYMVLPQVRLFNVPEYMLRNCLQYLPPQVLLSRFVKGLPQITSFIVLFL